MKRILVLFLSASLLTITVSFIPFAKKAKPIQTIIIDPGHGGRDGGARGLFSTEAQVCLEVGMKLGKFIENNFPGIKVLYTRTTDIIPGNKPDKNQGLRYRADFANESKGDLFIAIHCNSNGRRAGGWNEKRVVDYTYKKVWVGKGKKRRQVTKKYPVYQTFYVVNKTIGTETYIWAADRSDFKTTTINADSDDFSGENDSTIVAPDLNDPVMKAFQLLYQKKYFQNSLVFADHVEQEFSKTGRVSRGVKQRNDKGIWVLQATGMPSILIETGFITNKEEELYLNSDEGQEELVKNITDALRNYIASVDKQPLNNNTGNKLPEPKCSPSASAIINRNTTNKYP